MSNKTSTQKRTAAALPTRQTGEVCRTMQHRVRTITALYLVVLFVGIVTAVLSWRHFGPESPMHPEFDPAAVSGIPEVDQKYGYSRLDVADGYAVQLCGVPANDSQQLEFYLTNPAENTVWLRAEVRDRENRILGATGVLKQGEYLPAISLEEALTEPENALTLRIIAYEPEAWTSRGNVNLEVTVYQNYR